jgi:Domain of unknown function (DUF5979)
VRERKISRNGILHSSPEAIYNTGTMTLDDTEVSYNNADNGPGAIQNGGSLTIMGGSVVNNNTAHAYGGIWNDSVLIIQQSTIKDNVADSQRGGGIFNNCDATIIESTVSGNFAKGPGGGIINRGGVAGASCNLGLKIINSTIANNSAGTVGGGIHNCDLGPSDPSNCNGAKVSLTHATISGNNAATQGAGIYNNSGIVDINRTIVATNKVGANVKNCHQINGGTFNSLGYNLADDSTCSLNTLLGDIPSSPKPGLLSLANNGGSGAWTVALDTNLPSDAINAIPIGSCISGLTNDERGAAFPRPDAVGNRCDIGAFEVQPVTGTFELSKIVSPALAGADNLTFTYTLTCTDPYGVTVSDTSTFSTDDPVGGGQAAIGTECNFTEAAPVPGYGLPAGCTWNAPIYSPAATSGSGGTFTISAGITYASITNTYTCTTPGSLHIDKTVLNDGVVAPNTGASVNVDVKCVSNGITTTYANQTVPVAGGLTIANITGGSQCTIDELAPTTFNAGTLLCKGGSGKIVETYVPASAGTPAGVTVAGGGVTNVAITNDVQCDYGYIRIEKLMVANGIPVPAGYQFPIWIKCSNNPGWYPPLGLPLANGTWYSTNEPGYMGNAGFSNAPPSPSGISCAVQEGEGNNYGQPSFSITPIPPLAVPITACPSGFAQWSTSHAGTPAIVPVNSAAVVTITNTLSCAPQAPPPSERRGTSPGACPAGSVRDAGNGRCIRPSEPKPTPRRN